MLQSIQQDLPSPAASGNALRACIVCGGSASHLFTAKDYEHGVPGEWTLARCDSCGLVYQDPLPKPSDLAGFYPPGYSAYNSDTFISYLFRMIYALDAKRIAGLVEAHARVLDVGCGNGSMLMALKQLGDFDLSGVEIDPTAAQRARDRGFSVYTGELTDADLPEASFDLIRMGHMIEHVCDPVAVLRRAFRLLKPNGILFGETPNIDCLDFRIFGRYWGALHVPRHVILFDDVNLRRALADAGFESVRTSWGLRTVGWSAGIQNL
ncbi:MAG TPA: class I SAM-dependent methyltransferase, partial [Candidatus Binataceae bacterium]|nr:class I SAM-dependent methyltransferase [Candidatus Binataceae bacterium]